MGEAAFLEQMIALRENRDQEDAHKQGDEILIEALRHLGWNTLADEWVAQSQMWWWA